MKASHFIGFVLLNAFSILFRQVGGKQSANWAVHADTCRRYNQNFAGKEVQRAINIAKHAVNNLAGNNYDVIIRNFVQVLFNQDPNGGGLEWVQDVFAGEGPAKLPGIANFDRLVNEDSVVTGDLLVYCSGSSLSQVLPEYLDDIDESGQMIYDSVTQSFFPGVLPPCGAHYEGPLPDGTVSAPMVVTTAPDGINRIYICKWMYTQLTIHSEALPGNYIVYPDSRNAMELRARIFNWPLGENWFGTGAGTASMSFIDRFLQFDILFIEALTKTAAGGFRQDHLGLPFGWRNAISFSRGASAAVVKYNSGSYMFFALATLLYRTGFDIIADRSPESGDFQGTLPWNALSDLGS